MELSEYPEGWMNEEPLVSKPIPGARAKQRKAEERARRLALAQIAALPILAPPYTRHWP